MYSLDLAGKTAVVMGIANKRSIGMGVAEAINAAGADMVFTYVGEKFGKNVRELTEGFRNAAYYECDVSVDDDIERTFETIGREHGHIDMLVHSIAFAPREAISGDFIDTDREQFRIALDVSAYSLIHVARAAKRYMPNGGAIVAMSYLGAIRVIPRYNVMGTAKAALEHAVRQLAFELGPQNIRVNAISAGPVNTLSARGLRDFSEMLKHHENKSPLKRNVTLEDIGGTGLYLLSDMSSGVTGETIFVDAGYSIMGF